MKKRTIFLGLAAVAVAMAVSLSLVYAEENESSRRRPAPEARRQPPQGRAQRPEPRAVQRGGAERGAEQMNRMMLQGVRRQLDVTDEKWEELEPLISNVMELSNELRFTGILGMMGMHGRGMTAVDDEDKTPMQKAVDKLQEAVRDSEVSDELVSERLAEVRKEREKLEKELEEAREELLSEISMRQQATLVLMGLLD